MSQQNRPEIPEAIKREVRKRCAFGCVICGLPIYEYDHMEQYAVVNQHEAENLTLLCPNHHSQKTRGQITVDMVKQYNLNPYNIVNSQTAPIMQYFSGKVFRCSMGSNMLELRSWTKSVFLKVGDVNAIAVEIEEGRPMVNIILHDEDDRKILQVINNEVVLNTEQYDITFVGKTLKIWKEKRNIQLEIEFNPPDNIVISRANLNYGGNRLIVDKGVLTLNGNRELKENHFTDSGVGIYIEAIKKQVLPPIDDSFKRVVNYSFLHNIKILIGLGNKRNIGTAFSAESGGAKYLVTARHLLFDYIRGKFIENGGRVIVDIYGNKYLMRAFYIEEKYSDIAILLPENDSLLLKPQYRISQTFDRSKPCYLLGFSEKPNSAEISICQFLEEEDKKFGEALRFSGISKMGNGGAPIVSFDSKSKEIFIIGVNHGRTRGKDKDGKEVIYKPGTFEAYPAHIVNEIIIRIGF